MRTTHVFVDPSGVEENRLKITGPDFHHISRVLRFREGDAVIASDERNRYVCRIVSFSNKEITCEVLKRQKLAAPAITFSVFLPFLPLNRIEWSIQKLAELGAHRINVVNFDRSVLSGGWQRLKLKLPRWQRIGIAAANQSFQDFFPRIEAHGSLRESVESQRVDLLLVMHQDETEMLVDDCISGFDGLTIGTVVGPEGGFSQTELDYLKSVGALFAGLGKAILRSETAAIVGLALAQDAVRRLWRGAK